MLTLVENGNVGLRFLLELAVLVALGYWGFHTNSPPIFKVTLGIGAPLLALVVWGPSAPHIPRILSQTRGIWVWRSFSLVRQSALWQMLVNRQWLPV